MAAKIGRGWIEPYLDKQLGPTETAILENTLEKDPALQTVLNSHRSFHLFLSRALLRVRFPEGLDDRIHKRLDALASTPAKRPQKAFASWGVHWLRFAAALVLVSCGLVVYQAVCPPLGFCRYVSACSREHQQITSAVCTGNEFDNQRLKRVCTQGGCLLTGVPALDGYQAVDVGHAGFQALRTLGAPKAVFIRYQGSTGDPLVLFLHPWSSETPTVDKVVFQGQSFWFAEYNRVSVVCWRSTNGKILLSLTGSQTKDRMLDLATNARVALSEMVIPQDPSR